jgi:hypothetical protein
VDQESNNDKSQRRREIVADLHRLMERGDDLRAALAWQLEENARLRQQFAETVSERTTSAKRIQRLLARQMARAVNLQNGQRKAG